MANGNQGLGGLFSAPSVDQARQSRREQLFSQFVAGARTGGPGATFGAGLGSFISGLFGESPQVDRARRMTIARKKIQQEYGGVQGIAQSDEALAGAQKILAEQGLQREAQQLPFEVQQYRSQLAQSRFTQAKTGLTKAKTEQMRAGSGEASTQTEREVVRLMKRGFSRADAQDIAFGNVRVSQNPLTGETTLVNVATGEQRPLHRTDHGDQEEVAPVEQKQGLLDSKLDVGLVPWLQEGISRTFGQFFDSANNPSVTKARTKLRSAQQQLVSALAVSGRPPLIEQQRIINNLPSLGPFESPSRAATQLDTLLDDLMVQRRADKQSIENENLNPSLRKDIQKRVNAIDRMIRVIDPSRLSGEKKTSQSREAVTDETPSLETLRNNAEDTRTIDGRTFYFYKGQWWAE